MIDRYTKIMLTIIAVALLAAQFAPTAHAQNNAACGTEFNPCYIKSQDPLQVTIAH